MPRTRKPSPADPPTSSGAGRRTRGTSKPALEARIGELEARIDVLERVVRELSGQPHHEPLASPAAVVLHAPDSEVLEGEMFEAIRAVDREGRLDGLVPIPTLRRRFPSWNRLHVDRALLQLERRLRIDLKIANDPVTVQAPDEGILHPARGLLYYAVVR